jgi:hypothetical protein
VNNYTFQDTVKTQVLINPAINTLKTDTLEKPKPPTLEQIHYWRKQREKKMLIGDSRYIKPRTDVKLTTTETPNIGIGLPNNEKQTQSTDWLTVIIFTVLLLFASIRITYEKYLKHLFLSVFNYTTASRMFQEKNYNIFHASTRLEVFFYVVFSIFIYQLFNYFQLSGNLKDVLLFVIIFGLTIAYYLVKKMVYILLGKLFSATEETYEYLFNLDNSNKIAGLFLFPIISLIAFNPFKSIGFTVVLGIIILSFFYILLIQRGIFILLKKQFSIFYLFLYLCSLEFLPLLLIYKVVVM